MGHAKPDQIIRKARRSFIVEYGCAATLFGLTTAAAFTTPVAPLLYAGYSLATISFLTPEIQRLFIRYKLFPTKLLIVKGLFKQSKKHVYFHSLAYVPDINMKQSRTDRILGIGSISLSVGGPDSKFEIKDIPKPHKVMELIEEYMERSRTSPTPLTQDHSS